jgi:hypothetical protein
MMKEPATDDVARLTQIRHALLRLHKTLLDAQVVRHERVHGRVDSPGKLLQLVISNPAFDWLHRLSELVVQIDQAMEDKESPLTAASLSELVVRTKVLLTPDEQGDVFARKYFDALQSEPQVGVVHGEVVKLLKKTEEKTSS